MFSASAPNYFKTATISIFLLVTHPDVLKRQVYTDSFLIIHLQEILDGLEFAKGDASSTWGSVRASLGHPKPFDLRYVAIGNEECQMKSYRGMHFVTFFMTLYKTRYVHNIIIIYIGKSLTYMFCNHLLN